MPAVEELSKVGVRARKGRKVIRFARGKAKEHFPIGCNGQCFFLPPPCLVSGVGSFGGYTLQW